MHVHPICVFKSLIISIKPLWDKMKQATFVYFTSISKASVHFIHIVFFCFKSNVMKFLLKYIYSPWECLNKKINREKDFTQYFYRLLWIFLKVSWSVHVIMTSSCLYYLKAWYCVWLTSFSCHICNNNI